MFNFFNRFKKPTISQLVNKVTNDDYFSFDVYINTIKKNDKFIIVFKDIPEEHKEGIALKIKDFYQDSLIIFI